MLGERSVCRPVEHEFVMTQMGLMKGEPSPLKQQPHRSLRAQSIFGVNTLYISPSVERRGRSMSEAIVAYGNRRRATANFLIVIFTPSSKVL